VDLALHLTKTEDKLAKSKDKLSKLQDQIGAAGYKAKVDSETKEADEERLRNISAEVETLDTFVASLRKLTL
jgi:valyl-tRNA synthetase